MTNPLPPISFPYPNQRIVRITTDNIGAVTAAVPDAKPVHYYPTGHVQVDVDWTLYHMTALSMILQPAISTVFDGYAFNGKNKPFFHQYKIVEFLTRNPRGYCFAGMGTGKTRSACWAADYLMQMGVVKRALVVCTKSLMYSAWVDDITATCIHRSWTVLYGERATRERLATRNTDFDIINFDGVATILNILKQKKYDLIIIDESTAYKDCSTKRWKALSTLVRPETYIWALTGTPTPQGPMDAYGQARMVTPSRVPRTKTAFQSMVQIQRHKHIWTNKHDWQETVRNVLQPAIYIRKADCLDLPPVTRSFRDVGLSPAQAAALKSLRSNMIAEFQDDYQAIAANAAVLHGKLRQVYAGAIYATDGTPLMLDNTDRIAETIALIKQAKASGDDSVAQGRPHSKALVYVPFKHALTVVSDALKQEFDVAVISGDTSVHDRRHILQQFQTQQSPQVIVAIPEAFSHGVTATAASLIVWYAPPNRTETYLQACERTDRPSQTQHQNIVHLYGDGRERQLYQKLIDNEADQTALLRMYHDFLNQSKE